MLVASDPHQSAFFGDALDLEANRVLTVGGAYVDQPRLYEFERGGDGSWTLIAETVPPAATKFFGTEVVRHGDLALVTDQGSQAGGASTQMFARVPGLAELPTDWIVTLQTTGGYALGWQDAVFVIGIPDVDNDRGAAIIMEFTGAVAGETCAADDDCISGHCISNVCCGEPCSGCNVCTVAEGATRDGVCTTLSPTVCCPSDEYCDDRDPCTQDVCNAGVCSHDAVCCASAAECNDDDACTEDACAGGTCTHAPIDGCAPATTSDGGSSTADSDSDPTASGESSAGASSPSGDGCSCVAGDASDSRAAWWMVIALVCSRRRGRPRHRARRPASARRRQRAGLARVALLRALGQHQAQGVRHPHRLGTAGSMNVIVTPSSTMVVRRRRATTCGPRPRAWSWRNRFPKRCRRTRPWAHGASSGSASSPGDSAPANAVVPSAAV